MTPMTTNPTTARAATTIPITAPSDKPPSALCWILYVTETELQMSLCHLRRERTTFCNLWSGLQVTPKFFIA